MKKCDMFDALNDIENNPLYKEKVSMDLAMEASTPTRNGRRTNKTCAWVKKRNYKKKMVRRFLSANPDMDFSAFRGTNCSSGIYLRYFDYNNGDYYDPKMVYSFNIYTRVFLSPRGDLRKYRGDIFPIRMSYALGARNKELSMVTNRRIRHQPIDEETSNNYAYCKKLYSPYIDEIW